MELNLVEIFASAQGEGPYVGCSTIFVRLGGCDLRCSWCDSPATWVPAKRWRAERAPGSGTFERADNPATLEDVARALAELGGERVRFVSLTGGEPLLQADAVVAIGEAVRALPARLLLETHGLAVDAMARVRDVVDVVSMDWKLARDAAWEDDAKPPEFANQHREFLAIANAASEVYVKTIVTAETQLSEVENVAAEIAQVNPAVCLVLQPVTPIGRVRASPGPEALLSMQRACEVQLRDVRVIPQTHRAYGAL
ncbi:MAG: 7-carboxy-7-deazaguanine synthase QueE [bacterium]|nr:7-carboxy-7-deazaguanine synthase QueE [bacterium]